MLTYKSLHDTELGKEHVAVLAFGAAAIWIVLEAAREGGGTGDKGGLA